MQRVQELQVLPPLCKGRRDVRSVQEKCRQVGGPTPLAPFRVDNDGRMTSGW